MKKLLTTLCLSLLMVTAANAADDKEAVWKDLKYDLFAERQISSKAEWLTMEAPYRAHDAALVPIRIEAQLPKEGQYIKFLTLVIDNNPAPVAATMELSPKTGPLMIETRLRINEYSHVRAIAETNDGQLFMVAKYVKAAGGCSAPAMKDLDAKMAALGKMKLRQFTPKATPANVKMQSVREAQLMVRHPNYSGLQLNQETGYYIPAHYVSNVEISVDGELLIKLEGAISLSEDPTLRFRFLSKASSPVMAVTVKDTKQQTYTNKWELKATGEVGS